MFFLFGVFLSHLDSWHRKKFKKINTSSQNVILIYFLNLFFSFNKVKFCLM